MASWMSIILLSLGIIYQYNIIFFTLVSFLTCKWTFRNYNPVERRSKVCKERHSKGFIKNSKSLQANNAHNPCSVDGMGINKINGQLIPPLFAVAVSYTFFWFLIIIVRYWCRDQTRENSGDSGFDQGGKRHWTLC